MKLYLNKDIAADAEKVRYWMSGDDAISFSDISAFLDYMAENAPDDNRIDLEIHSCGGDCVEGWAIYDALRASGKEIHACVVGQCASMATVILLAAPYENRTMYEHARLLIHEPYYPNGLQGSMTIGKLEGVQTALRDELNRMLSVYTDRTGTDTSLLMEQISLGEWFDAPQALALKFVSSVVPTASASVEAQDIISTTKTNKKEMQIKEDSALAKAYIAMGKALGVIDAPKALTLTDVTGVEIEIDREEGEPQVGDTTNAADGEYVLEDGRTLVVKDGAIVEIKTPEEEAPEEEETPDAEEKDEKDEKIATLEAEVEELKKKLEEANANAKSENDKALLEAVAKAGGMDAIKAVAVGNFVAPARSAQKTPVSTTAEHLEEKRKAIIEKRNKK